MENVMELKSVLLGSGLANAVTTASLAETWKLAVTDVEGMERMQLDWGPLSMDLVAFEDRAYDYVRSMYANAGYPQFDDFIGD